MKPEWLSAECERRMAGNPFKWDLLCKQNSARLHAGIRPVLIEEVSRLHKTLVKARSSVARAEAAQHALRTNSSDTGEIASAKRFGRDIDRFSTDILDEISVQIKRKRHAQTDDRRHIVRKNETKVRDTEGSVATAPATAGVRHRATRYIYDK